MQSFQKTLVFLCEKLRSAGAVFSLGMVLLTFFDVVGRIFKHPIFGSVELVSFMAVLAIGLSLPLTHENKGHIGVELFYRKLPKTFKALFSFITELLGLILFAIISFQVL